MRLLGSGEHNLSMSEQPRRGAPGRTGQHQAVSIDASLVRRLVRAQFPQWADLPIAPVEPDGWDNRTFRLGDGMTVRLPSAGGYAPQVAKEHRWLPFLAPRLPLPIPVPLAKGVPGAGYPFPWSVYRWLDGRNATIDRIRDLREFATTLADFRGPADRRDRRASSWPAQLLPGGAVGDLRRRDAARDRHAH